MRVKTLLKNVLLAAPIVTIALAGFASNAGAGTETLMDSSMVRMIDWTPVVTIPERLAGTETLMGVSST